MGSAAGRNFLAPPITAIGESLRPSRAAVLCLRLCERFFHRLCHHAPLSRSPNRNVSLTALINSYMLGSSKDVVFISVMSVSLFVCRNTHSTDFQKIRWKDGTNWATEDTIMNFDVNLLTCMTL